jgi:hypothetical protein
MDTQLSRFIQPCRSSLVPFDGTISSERVAPTACTRLPTARFFNHTLPEKALVKVTRLAGPAAGEAEALARLSSAYPCEETNTRDNQ